MIKFFGLLLHTLGEVMVGFTAIMVHHRVWREHKIDRAVFNEMNKEQKIALLGLVFIVVGFLIEGSHYLVFP